MSDDTSRSTNNGKENGNAFLGASLLSPNALMAVWSALVGKINSLIALIILMVVQIFAFVIYHQLAKKKQSDSYFYKPYIKYIVLFMLHLSLMIIIGGVINKYHFDILWDFEKYQITFTLIFFLGLLISSFFMRAIIRWFMSVLFHKKDYNQWLIHFERDEVLPAKDKYLLRRLTFWESYSRKYLLGNWEIILLCFNIFCATLITYFIPNIIPSFINNLPATHYRIEEKIYQPHAFLWSLSSSGDTCTIIYKDDESGWVKYEGEYLNWKPHGNGKLTNKNGDSIYEGTFNQGNRETSTVENFSLKNIYDDAQLKVQENSSEYYELAKYKFRNCEGRLEDVIYEKGRIESATFIIENNPLYQSYNGGFSIIEIEGNLETTNNNYGFVYHFSRGTLTFLDNNKEGYFSYSGNFDNEGDFTGDNAILIWRSGSIYDGAFKKGKMTFGTLAIKAHSAYSHDWGKNFNDGDEFIGGFYYEDNSKNYPKNGKLTFSNNKYYEWFEGDFDDKGNMGSGCVKIKGKDIIIEVDFEFKSDALDKLLIGTYSVKHDSDDLQSYKITFSNDPEYNTVSLVFKNHIYDYASFEGTVKDGDIGEFKSGKATYSDNQSKYKAYIGPFDSNLPHTIKDSHGETPEKGTMFYSDGNLNLEKYEGAWDKGSRHGKGKLTFKVGNTNKLEYYDGYWKNDVPHAREELKSKLKWLDEDTYYEGNFSKGLFNGEGTKNIGEICFLRGSFKDNVFEEGEWRILISKNKKAAIENETLLISDKTGKYYWYCNNGIWNFEYYKDHYNNIIQYLYYIICICTQIYAKPYTYRTSKVEYLISCIPTYPYCFTLR
jgi:Uncharacterized protein conserved in bacteria